MNAGKHGGRTPIFRRVLRPLALLAVVAAIVASSEFLSPLIVVTGRLLGEQGPAAALLYVLVAALGIVVMPLSSMPLIPIAAAAWGVVLGGVLSILGWWIGAMAAFLIGRYLGRPFLCRIVSEEKLAAWEAKIPSHASFFTVVLMRLVLPVEIPSYLLGLTRAIRFRPYAIASLIGMTPFAFVILAMGGAVAAGEWIRLSLIGLAAAAAVYLLYLVYSKRAAKP